MLRASTFGFGRVAVHSWVMKTNWIVMSAVVFALVPGCRGQRPGAPSPELVAQRNAMESELESVAIIERKVMVPMRDGKRMSADIYRPKDQSKKYPIIFSRTPYNFNYWDVRNGTYADMSTPLGAVKRGYAYVVMNERGHFFSEAITTSLVLRLPMVRTRSRGSPDAPGRTASWAPSAAHRRPSGNWRWPLAALPDIPR